jgi:hypothetical protein
MKEKLLDALKLKFPGVSETTLSIIATNKAGSVTDEAQITSIVEGITVDIIIQSATDHRIADANKKHLQNYEKQHGLKDGKPVKQTETDTDDNVPAWAKTLMKQNEELQQKVLGFETKTKQQTLSEKLKAKLDEKKIPVHLMKGRVINDESEIDTVFTEIESDYAEIRQTLVNETVISSGPGRGLLKSKAELAKEIEEWKERTMSENTETKKT